MNPLLVGLVLLACAVPFISSSNAGTPVARVSSLTLTEALQLAAEHDPWQKGSDFREQALIEASEASAQLPDPRIKLMAGNLPVDGWSLDQEPMTQLSVGIQQLIPRGDSLSLSRSRGYHQVSEEREQRLNRAEQVQLRVTQLWLDVLQGVMTRDRLIASKPLFSDLEALIQARYRSGIVNASQADMVSATVEATRLEERITRANQTLALAQQQLYEWIGERAFVEPDQTMHMAIASAPFERLVDEALRADDTRLFSWLAEHPRLRAFAARIETANTDIALAEQSIKPAWTLEASYGYRADDPLGRDRADLFSLGVSFDVPLFTRERQDRSIRASKASAASLETERQLLIRELLRRLRSAAVNFQHAQDRYSTYANSLMPQLRLHADTALLAYNNDQADLSEAIVAHIARLNSEIELIQVDIDRYRALAEMAYLTDMPVVSESEADLGENQS